MAIVKIRYWINNVGYYFNSMNDLNYYNSYNNNNDQNYIPNSCLNNNINHFNNHAWLNLQRIIVILTTLLLNKNKLLIPCSIFSGDDI